MHCLFHWRATSAVCTHSVRSVLTTAACCPQPSWRLGSCAALQPHSEHPQAVSPSELWARHSGNTPSSGSAGTARYSCRGPPALLPARAARTAGERAPVRRLPHPAPGLPRCTLRLAEGRAGTQDKRSALSCAGRGWAWTFGGMFSRKGWLHVGMGCLGRQRGHRPGSVQVKDGRSTQCHNLVGTVVLGHRLNSMILEVFSKPTDSVSPPGSGGPLPAGPTSAAAGIAQLLEHQLLQRVVHVENALHLRGEPSAARAAPSPTPRPFPTPTPGTQAPSHAHACSARSPSWSASSSCRSCPGTAAHRCSCGSWRRRSRSADPDGSAGRRQELTRARGSSGQEPPRLKPPPSALPPAALVRPSLARAECWPTPSEAHAGSVSHDAGATRGRHRVPGAGVWEGAQGAGCLLPPGCTWLPPPSHHVLVESLCGASLCGKTPSIFFRVPVRAEPRGRVPLGCLGTALQQVGWARPAPDRQKLPAPHRWLFLSVGKQVRGRPEPASRPGLVKARAPTHCRAGMALWRTVFTFAHGKSTGKKGGERKRVRYHTQTKWEKYLIFNSEKDVRELDLEDLPRNTEGVKCT